MASQNCIFAPTFSRIVFRIAAVVFLVSTFVSTTIAQPTEAEIPRSWLTDVELNDVFFINEELGWAVGEHGTILKTTDGGESWKHTANLKQVAEEELAMTADMARVLGQMRSRIGENAAPRTRAVPTGIKFRFESVHFSDEQHGLVVGGYDLPYVNRSRAVVMKTIDGGSSWQVIRGLVVPRLNKVHMNNPFDAWALGDSGNLFPAGVYTSADGGKSWSSQTNNAAGDLLDGTRTNKTVVAVDSLGKIRVVDENEATLAEVESRPGAVCAPIRAIEMVDGNYGWAVGYAGQLLQTMNGGLSWKAYYPAELDSETQFDFFTATTTRGKLWVAGNPGTYILSLDLKTGAIKKHRTPVTSQINAITFASPDKGWAVGSDGAILATVDGGQTWQLQRAGTNRVALLAVSLNSKQFPVNVLTQYAGENNLSTATVHLNFCRSTSTVATADNDDGSSSESRMKLAASRLGCNKFETLYPASPDAETGYANAVRLLARTIRSSRPNAIVCESDSVRLPDGSFVDAQELLDTAIQAAKDRYQFSDQLVEMGLAPWKVDRLAVYDGSNTGGLKLNTDRFLPQLGRAIHDNAAISAGLLGMPICENRAIIFRVKQYSTARAFKGIDLFTGLRELGRQIPERDDANSRRGNLQIIQRNVEKRKELNGLASWRDTRPQSLLVWRQQLNGATLGQDSDLAGVWMVDLSNRYMQAGQWQMAALTLSQLVERYPNHPFASSAILWLAQYHSSDEMLAKRIKQSNQTAGDQKSVEDQTDLIIRDHQVQPASFTTTPQSFSANGVQLAVWVPDEVKKEIDSELNRNQPQIDPLTASLQTASSIITRLRARDPDFARDRNVRFLEAKLTGRIQNEEVAENMFRQLVQGGREGDSVFVASGREIRLAHAEDASIESPIAAKIATRPNLDGVLDDECWNAMFAAGQMQLIKMTPPGREAQPRTDVVLFGHDADFFYIAARCNKLARHTYRESNKARSRDAKIQNEDRIEIVLDTDRDYSSFLNFEVDHRGWCRDGSNAGNGWDPEWYVAQNSDEKSWTIEVAIPLEQLTAASIDENSAWVVSLARRVGRKSPNLWSTPSLDIENQQIGLHQVSEFRADGFQLLQFETPAANLR